jgi:hypothetical protein
MEHLILLGVVLVGLAIPVVWFWPASRVERKDMANDDAIDAAASHALKELRERGAGRK